MGSDLKKPNFALAPEKDVEIHGGRFIAMSTEPWLSIEAGAALAPGKFVEIVYRASLWDEPARPVFRFWTSTGVWTDRIATGPVAGAGLWMGRIPPGTIRISVSPANRLGRFDFVVESMRRISSGALFTNSLRRRPGSALAAVLAGHFGRNREDRIKIDWTSNAKPIENYGAWRETHTRAFNLEGIDAPRHDWTTSLEIHIIVDAEQADAAALARLITSLRAQLYPRWRLILAADGGISVPAGEPRIFRLPRGEAHAALRALPPEALVAALEAGDALSPFALAAVIEAATRAPSSAIFYADEDFRRADHKLIPVLKPGWSPTLQACRPYLGRAAFLRARIFGDWTEAELASFIDHGETRASAELAAFAPHALRRVLLTRSQPWPQADERISAPAPRPAGHPAALLVIPTRDRAGPLSLCLASIFEKTAFDNFSVIIVDGGSVEPAALRLFEKFRGDRIVSVLHSAEPINDSALCNAAAARRKADVLVFLDDDMEILAEDWLDRLVARALLQDVGAVGGLISDVDGSLRQAGLWFNAQDQRRRVGAALATVCGDLLGRDKSAHEVSAVPRAGLAVARRKFMLVGGFDAEHVPTIYNDLDLCLRLSAKGWTTQIDPGVRLGRVSGARRAAPDAQSAEGQRRWIEARWLGALREDPFFHPALASPWPEETLG